MLMVLVLILIFSVGSLGHVVHPQPLRVMDQDDTYATDGNYVYQGDQPIWGADPATFISLNNGYAMDWHHVYQGAKTIQGADPKTFFVLGSDYGKDAQHVFYDSSIIPGADAHSFAVLGIGGYAKDQSMVYYEGTQVSGADPASFVISDSYSTGYDAKDANTLYTYGYPISAAQAAQNLKSNN
jgi:hypothetical protein